MSKGTFYFNTAVALYMSTAPIALAQEATPANPSAVTAKNSGQIEEITVTAEKRVENFKEVPASISVLSEKAIADAHIEDLTDLTRSTPSISFSGAGPGGTGGGIGAGLDNIEIRGVSSTAGAPTVGIYLNDVSMAVISLQTVGQPEVKLFDIGSIEVLRGPQGTLYGAGSEGGTIKYITNPVDLENYGGSLHTELSATNHSGGQANYNFNGVLNIPIIPDKLGLRIGAATITDAGYIDQYSAPTTASFLNSGGTYQPDLADTAHAKFLNSGVNTDRTNVFLAELKAVPIEGLTITPSIFDQRLKADNMDTSSLGVGLPQWSENKGVQENDSDVLIVPSLTVNYDLGWADVTSVSSYLYRRLDRTTDGTTEDSGYYGALLDGSGITGLDGLLHGTQIAALPAPVHYNTLNAQLSEELRLTSKPYNPNGGGLPITWIAGLYWSDDKVTSEDLEFIPGFNPLFSSLYGANGYAQNIAANNTINAPFPGGEVFQGNRDYDTHEFAGFGEINYYITPALRVTAGLRYLFANTSYSQISDYNFTNGFNQSDPQNTAAPHGHGYAATPKFALNYDIDDNNSAYATASKGFRLGGDNEFVPSNVCAPSLKLYGLTEASPTYNSDSLWSYELGEKLRLLDSHLTINPSLYYITWKNIQQPLPLTNCGFEFITNVGTAESYGGELDVSWKPVQVPGLTLSVNGGYTHATFTTSIPDYVTAGDPLTGVPKWTTTVSGEYIASITDSIDGFVRANYAETGESHGSVTRTNPNYDDPSYGTLGASAGVAYGDWEFSVFGKNLTNDKKYLETPNINVAYYSYTLRPLTIGIQADAKF